MLPQKESAITEHMNSLIQKFVDKGLLEFSYVHHLLWEYTQELVRAAAAAAAPAAAAAAAAGVEGREGKKTRMDDLVRPRPALRFPPEPCYDHATPTSLPPLSLSVPLAAGRWAKWRSLARS